MRRLRGGQETCGGRFRGWSAQRKQERHAGGEETRGAGTNALLLSQLNFL